MKGKHYELGEATTGASEGQASTSAPAEQNEQESKGGDEPAVEENTGCSSAEDNAEEQPFDVVGLIKGRRVEIDTLINSAKILSGSREVALLITNLQRAKMWLGKTLQVIGSPDPYPGSATPSDPTIGAQADHSNDVLDWSGLTTHVSKIKSLRACAQVTADHLKESAERIEYSGEQSIYKVIYYMQSILALEEAKMWGGWELDRIREATQ